MEPSFEPGRHDGHPPADPEEPTRSAFAHATHFLSRTLRCQGEDQERAMRLYHHSELMRRLLPELCREHGDEPRAAIRLRDAPPSPHAVVTREGRFVTCLDETMATDLRVIPYAVIEAEMQAEDVARGIAQRGRRQLAELPLLDLGRALLEGYGHVTREMVELILVEPRTYAYPVLKTFVKVYGTWARLWQALPFHPEPKAVHRRQLKMGAVCRMCLPLLSAMDMAGVTEYLAGFLSFRSSLEIDVIAALCRHRGGGEVLLRTAVAEGLPPRTRMLIVTYFGHHLIHFPEHAPAMVPRIRALYGPELSAAFDDQMRALYDTLMEAPEEACIARFREQRALPLPNPMPASRCYELTQDDYLDTIHSYYPVSHLFPPAAIAGEVRRRWAAQMQSSPLPPRPRSGIRPLQRAAPRVGRNDACPCGSGRKHKHCCLHASPPSAEPAPGP